MAIVEQTFDAEIDRLAALQEIDCQIKDKADRAALLTGEADSFEAELARQQQGVAQLTAERDALESQRLELEAQLEADGGKIRDRRMRLNRVRNATELMAIQREIDLTKESNQQLEEHLLSIMMTLEAVTARVGEAQAALAAMQAQIPDEVAARRAEAADLRGQVDGERHRRDEVAQGMNPSLRSKYEQIFQRRGGSAVVTVRQGVCLGCHMNVPPQMFNELQKFRDIRQCPNCHRIMYWRPEPAAESAPTAR